MPSPPFPLLAIMLMRLIPVKSMVSSKSRRIPLLPISAYKARFFSPYKSFCEVIMIIIHNLYSAALLKDPAALYNNDNVNIKSVR